MGFWDKARETIAGVAIDVITSDKVQAHLKALLADMVKNHVLPIVPLAIQTAVPIAVKAAMDQLILKFPGAKDLIEGAIDTAEVIDQTRSELNVMIPDIDFGIPALDAMLDIWRPKKG